jgi:hypothetical protein
VCVESGIAPSVLINEDEKDILAMWEYINWRRTATHQQ